MRKLPKGAARARLAHVPNSPRPPWMLFSAVISFFVIGSIAGAEDWPVARGDAQSTGVAQSSLASSPALLWRYEVPESSFEATAIVVGSVVYLGDVDGTFHAVKVDTGESVWMTTFEETGFLSAAAIANGRLWVGDYNGVFRCLSTQEGTEHWQQTLAAEVMAGPNLHEGNVLVTTEAGTFTSFDAESGEQQWEFVLEAPLRCTPTVVGGRAMLAGCDGKLHAIDLATGEDIESIEIDGPTGNTPAAVGGRLYFGTEQGTFFAIDAGKSPMSIAWKFADPRRRQSIRSAAAVNDALAVFGSHGKRVYAIELATGEKKWTFPTRTRVESSPLIAGNSVIVATQRGKIHLVDLDSGKSTWTYDAGGGFIASPVVVDGKLIIGNTDGTLYCFGKKGTTDEHR